MNTVNVKVNFSEIDGFIKPMHSVNIDVKDAEEYKLYVGFSDFTSENGVKVTYSLLDSEHNSEPVSEEMFFGSKGAHILKLPMYTTVLVSLTKL